MYAKHFLTNSLKNFQLESGLELGFFKVKKKLTEMKDIHVQVQNTEEKNKS